MIEDSVTALAMGIGNVFAWKTILRVVVKETLNLNCLSVVL